MTDFQRLRRMRLRPALREMRAECGLRPSQLIKPLFFCEGLTAPRAIESMPGQFQYPVDGADQIIGACMERGVNSFLLFGVPLKKDTTGSGAHKADGIIQRVLRRCKGQFPEAVWIADTCLCEYTDNGQCGLLRDGVVDNDPTLDLIVRTAVSQAEAGADMIAPSVMIDGMVAAIRGALDDRGFESLPILAYSAKYASAFYGPFREAAGSMDCFRGDRRNHQLDVRNRREALLEMEADIAEGADIVMVKPALAYLDIIRAARDSFRHPICAYSVSGEYAMIKQAAAAGMVDGEAMAREVLTAIVRAGADLVITYFAGEL